MAGSGDVLPFVSLGNYYHSQHNDSHFTFLIDSIWSPKFVPKASHFSVLPIPSLDASVAATLEKIRDFETNSPMDILGAMYHSLGESMSILTIELDKILSSWNRSEKAFPDMLLAHSFYGCLSEVTADFGIPTLQLRPYSPPITPSIYYMIMRDYLVYEYTFLQKVKDVVYHIPSLLFHTLPAITKMEKEFASSLHFKGLGVFDWNTRGRIIHTQIPSFGYVDKPVPGAVLTGPLINEQDLNTPLHSHIEEWIRQSGPSSIIAVAFGSTGGLRREDSLTLLQALLQSNHRVLVSTRAFDMQWIQQQDPSMVNSSSALFLHWIPQQQVLAREEIVLLVTHGGFGSTSEALFFGKPLIAFPMIADQFPNTQTIITEKVGFGFEPRKGFTKEQILHAVQQLTASDSIYQKNAKKFLKLCKHVGRGLERATEVIEEAFAFPSIDHLVLKDESFSAVFWVLGAILLFIGVLLYKSCQCCLRKLWFVKKKQE